MRLGNTEKKAPNEEVGVLIAFTRRSITLVMIHPEVGMLFTTTTGRLFFGALGSPTREFLAVGKTGELEVDDIDTICFIHFLT